MLDSCYISTLVVPDCFMTVLIARPSEPRFAIISTFSDLVGNHVAIRSGSVACFCESS